jgi:hypothetical protein
VGVSLTSAIELVDCALTTTAADAATDDYLRLPRARDASVV